MNNIHQDILLLEVMMSAHLETDLPKKLTVLDPAAVDSVVTEAVDAAVALVVATMAILEVVSVPVVDQVVLGVEVASEAVDPVVALAAEEALVMVEPYLSVISQMKQPKTM